MLGRCELPPELRQTRVRFDILALYRCKNPTLKTLFQAAAQAEEGNPDGHPKKQGNQRRVDSSQQRTPTTTEGQSISCLLTHASLETADVRSTRATLERRCCPLVVGFSKKKKRFRGISPVT